MKNISKLCLQQRLAILRQELEIDEQHLTKLKDQQEFDAAKLCKKAGRTLRKCAPASPDLERRLLSASKPVGSFDHVERRIMQKERRAAAVHA